MGKVFDLHVGQLGPSQRSGDITRGRTRRRTRRLVPSVLVVIDENAIAFLLPPLGGDQAREGASPTPLQMPGPHGGCAGSHIGALSAHRHGCPDFPRSLGHPRRPTSSSRENRCRGCLLHLGRIRIPRSDRSRISTRPDDRCRRLAPARGEGPDPPAERNGRCSASVVGTFIHPRPLGGKTDVNRLERGPSLSPFLVDGRLVPLPSCNA